MFRSRIQPAITRHIRKDIVTEIKTTPQNVPDVSCNTPQDDEINLLDYWRVIWKRRKMIVWIVLAVVFLTAGYSLTLTNIYQAKAIITPVTGKDTGGGGLSALASQFGGVAGMAGLALPGSASSAEIVGLLKSNILREKMIQQYNLMPILFHEQWDKERQAWKKGGGFSLNPLTYVSMLTSLLAPAPPASTRKKEPGAPDTWDALRLLDGIVKVNQDIKANTITVSVEYHDPDMAAKLVEYFLNALINHMSSETKRVAQTNRKYLEEQLGTTADPFIKQKTYNLIAQQIETSMMAEVKENFAFKVIDPPLAPDKKIKPNRAQMVMLSFVVALFLGIFVAFFMEYLEKVKAGNKNSES